MRSNWYDNNGKGWYSRCDNDDKMQYIYTRSLNPDCTGQLAYISIYVDVPKQFDAKTVNSSPPYAVYMYQWSGVALVQIMACRLFGAKPLSKPMLDCCHWTLRNKLQWNFNQNAKLFIRENACENIVLEMAAILSRGRWVNCKCQEVHQWPHTFPCGCNVSMTYVAEAPE